MNPIDSSAEWLEADGLGGFASGTVSGIRTRRYHALLLTATTPPAGRMVLVNGFDAWVETPDGTFAISSQRYAPDVVHPDGASRIESFEYEPWPRWRYRIDERSDHRTGALRSARAIGGDVFRGRLRQIAGITTPAETESATVPFRSRFSFDASREWLVSVSSRAVRRTRNVSTLRRRSGGSCILERQLHARTRPGIGIFFMPKNRRAGLMPLKISLRLASLTFQFPKNRRCSCSRLKDTRSPTSNPSKRVTPRSERTSCSRRENFRSSARTRRRRVSRQNAAKAKRSSRVIRGLAIGVAMLSSRCAAFALQRAGSKKRAIF